MDYEQRILRNGYVNELDYFFSSYFTLTAVEEGQAFLNTNLRMFYYSSYNFTSTALYSFPWKNEKVSQANI